jgi:carboxyl-terminal processing protease
MRHKFPLVFVLIFCTVARAWASPASEVSAQFLNYLENYYVEPDKLDLKTVRERLTVALGQECAEDANCPSSKIHAELSAIVKSFPDKTSRFLTPQEAAQKRLEAKGDSLTDARFGLGLELRKSMVYRVLDNSPADKAGVLIGDVVLNIVRNNQPWTKNLEFSDNAPVTFMLERRKVALEKSMIPELGWLTNLAFPEARVLKPGRVGYIRVPSFRMAGTAARVHAQIANLLSARAPALILDLRFNSGGSLDEMLLTLSGFMDGEVLQLRARNAAQVYSLKNGGIDAVNGGKTSRYALEKPTSFKGSLIVLTNSSTSNAAELFALILQRRQVARFIGESSFGQCQTALAPLQLLDQSELRLATVKNLFANGETIPDKLEPDYAMIDDFAAIKQGHDLVLETAVSWLEPANLLIKWLQPRLF